MTSTSYQAPTPIKLHTGPNGTNIETVYDIFGEASDPAVLMISGLGAQMISWDEQLCAELASRGYRVIRFDNRDVGMATKFNGVPVPDLVQLLQARVTGTINGFEVPYSLYDMAADTIALMDELDIEKAHVIGASMGGAIAQLLAIEHPERLLTLTAIMTSSGCPSLPLPKPEAIAVFTRPESPNREEYINGVIAGWHVLYGSGYPLDEEDARARAGYFYDRAYYPEGAARQLAATAVLENLKPKLAEVTVPTLVIHGDEDPLFPIECGRDIAVSVPGAKMIVLEGVGHSLPKPTWARVIAALDSFFTDHPG